MSRHGKAEVRVAVITATTIETLAVERVLDDVAAAQLPDDRHPYRIGTLPSRMPDEPHVVALVQQTSDGTRDAAWLCGHLPHTFRGLRTIVLCGIAGGVPSADPGKNVALGDVVVATDLVDYRHERLVDGVGTVRETLQPPGSAWMNADHEVELEELRGSPPWLPVLATASRAHPFGRPEPGVPRVHRGRVGSADLLLRDAVFRDGLARDHRILAFEMEGAGLAIGSHLGDRSYYMVRGIVDHGDNAKGDIWHPYASLAAAAYLRSVLARCTPLAPTPERSRPSELDPLSAMTDALAELRVMRDETHRRAVLEQLPPRIRVQIPENSLGRLHIIETIRALERYPDGLDALLEALRRTLGSQSPDFVEIEGILRANWAAQ